MIIWVSLVVVFPFWFLILLIYMLSLCPLVFWWRVYLSCWFFSKNQLLVLLILCSILFVSNWLISVLSLTISCPLLLLGVFASFCSKAFRCAVKLLVLGLSNFFMKLLSAMNFSLNTAFTISYKFGYTMSSFSFEVYKVFDFFLYFFPDQLIIEQRVIQFAWVCGLSVVFVVIGVQPWFKVIW